jgi:hypothetical protein
MDEQAEGRLRQEWAKLYPADKWPGAFLAVRVVVGEVLLLRDSINNKEKYPQQPAAAVQRAHDILSSALFADLLMDMERPLVISALDALCWVLRHDHNTHFAENMQKLLSRIADAGQVLERYDELQNPGTVQ